MATYYIATDGSDSNSGSQTNPWYSLNPADGTVSGGDEIIVEDGTYDYSQAQNISSSGGSSGNRIHLHAADGASPVFDFGGSSGGGWSAWDQGGVRIGPSYWLIEGLTVRNSPYHGFEGKSDVTNLTIRNCTAHGNYLCGVYIQDAADCLVEGCESYDNYGGSGGDSDGFQAIRSDNVTFRGCTAYYNSDDGYDFWRTHNSLVEDCEAYYNGRDQGDGNGFKMGGNDTANNETSGNNTAVRCRAWMNGQRGFTTNNATDPVYYYHCTAWDNPDGFVVWEDNGHELYNNIAYENDNGNDFGATFTESNNTWTLGISDPQFRSTSTNSSDGPGNGHPDTPGDFLHLAEGSPCIDAGTSISGTDTDDVSDGEPDLGAFEYDSGGGGGGGTDGVQMYYYDGSGWQTVQASYYDGQSFQSIN